MIFKIEKWSYFTEEKTKNQRVRELLKNTELVSGKNLYFNKEEAHCEYNSIQQNTVMKREYLDY